MLRYSIITVITKNLNSLRGIFGQLAGGARWQRPREHGGLDERDEIFIERAAGLSKWSDARYYGPGSRAAEARRREALGLDAPAPAEVKKIRRKRSGAARLKARLRRLEKEIAELEGQE